MMNHSDIIIIGAGACGLMAACELLKMGQKITVLEAKPFAGGRIHTIQPQTGAFLQPVEAGAEFVHGNLPLTLQLLNEANIKYTKISGDMLRNSNGTWHETEEQIEGWDELMQKMSELEHDTTFSEFLHRFFNEDKYNALRQSALQYAQGFDAVDPDKASVFSLRNEWQHEEENTFRIEGGYGQLINYLLNLCSRQNCSVAFDKEVTFIEWKEGEVNITTKENEVFYAQQVIVTVPLGVLQNEDGASAAIQFSPSLPKIKEAIDNIGYGNVIKILLQFSSSFWQDQKDVLFFFSDQKIAVWWTQLPSHYPLLTGWIAGKKADEFNNLTEEAILQMAVKSIANIFKKTGKEIEQLITASHLVNWQHDRFAAGAYSYNTVLSEEAKQQMNEPIKNTLFFAGEAMYFGALGGTVEAALESGRMCRQKG